MGRMKPLGTDGEAAMVFPVLNTAVGLVFAYFRIYDSTGTVAKFLQDRSQFVLSKVYNDSGKQINENEFNRQEELAAEALHVWSRQPRE